jgi:hypothetical protein
LFGKKRGVRALKNPERIAGLLCIRAWALMVLALMERQVRREPNVQLLYGLYPEGHPSPAPTGPSLIQKLSGLSIVIIHEGRNARSLVGVDEDRCRPEHHRRRARIDETV